MSNLVNFRMSVFQGKKTEVVGSKVSEQELEILQSICDKEDRSMSYVLRELAIRGLAYYLKDGLLRTTPDEDKRLSWGRTHSAPKTAVLKDPVKVSTPARKTGTK